MIWISIFWKNTKFSSSLNTGHKSIEVVSRIEVVHRIEMRKIQSKWWTQALGKGSYWRKWNGLYVDMWQGCHMEQPAYSKHSWVPRNWRHPKTTPISVKAWMCNGNLSPKKVKSSLGKVENILRKQELLSVTSYSNCKNRRLNWKNKNWCKKTQKKSVII